MTTDLESLERRVACVEREDRRLKHGGALLILAFAALGLLGQFLLGGVSSVWAAEGRLSEEEVRQSNAALAELKRRPELYRQMVAGIQSALSAFGFGIALFDGGLDANTREAIRKYQRIRQLAETGEIDLTTWLKITRDFDVLMASPVVIPPGTHFDDASWDQGYVLAKGTLIAVGHEQGYPVQRTEMQCYKDRKDLHSGDGYSA